MNILNKLFSQNKIPLTKDQEKKLELLSNILKEENEKYNLTRILSDEDIAIKHFFDSALLTKYIDKGTLIDIGSGAGFPGIVLAILTDLEITLVESTRKKAKFLSLVVDRLNLTNVKILNKRAEDMEEREIYDYATARAVASLNITSEYAIPFLKVGGIFLSQKGPKYLEELENVDLKAFNAKLNKIENIDLEGFSRIILLIEKIGPTNPKYPRSFSNIKRDKKQIYK